MPPFVFEKCVTIFSFLKQGKGGGLEMSLIATRDKCSQISIYYSNGCVNAVWKSIYVIPFSFIDMFKRLN